MSYKKYIDMENAKVPYNVSKYLEHPNANTPITFDNKNIIFTDEKFQHEIGFTKLSNGTYLVAMYVKMPNVTADMINWWFWWYPQENERYQLCYPGKHIRISYSKKDKNYFKQFKPNSQYPT